MIPRSSRTKLLENVPNELPLMQQLPLFASSHFLLLLLLPQFLFFKAFLAANEAKAPLAPIQQQLSITAKLFSTHFRFKRVNF